LDVTGGAARGIWSGKLNRASGERTEKECKRRRDNDREDRIAGHDERGTVEKGRYGERMKRKVGQGKRMGIWLGIRVKAPTTKKTIKELPRGGVGKKRNSRILTRSYLIMKGTSVHDMSTKRYQSGRKGNTKGKAVGGYQSGKMQKGNPQRIVARTNQGKGVFSLQEKAGRHDEARVLKIEGSFTKCQE